MLGWMIIFGLTFFAAVSTLVTSLSTSDYAGVPLSLEVATVLSGFLLLAFILTRLARGRA